MTVSISKACQFLGTSRQAYYQSLQRHTKKKRLADRVLAFVRQVRMRQPRIGTRKLLYLIHRDQVEIKIGRDQLFDILREEKLLVPHKRSYQKTTYTKHHMTRHPNYVKDGPNQIIPTNTEQVWVADITYLPITNAFVFLSLVTDAYSRKIVGHHVHKTLHATSVIESFKMALKSRKKRGVLVHHSDRGLQYCSALYQTMHKKNKVLCSMTDGYDCYQNALAERINGILKTEFLIYKPKNLDEAAIMVKEAIYIYNNERPHTRLQYKTPNEVHQNPSIMT